MATPQPIPAARTAIPVYAAGMHAGFWHDPLPDTAANDHRVLIKSGGSTVVLCHLSEADDGPRLHFYGWSELLHLAECLRQRGRGDVLTFLPVGGDNAV